MKPKKKFGQHFLNSPSVIRQIIESAEIGLDTHVLEIGPGQGALTKSLVAQSENVTVIEIDPDMQEIIAEKFPPVKILAADASQMDFAEFLNPTVPWKCVSNLPYNVGTKIVVNLLRSTIRFEKLVLMLQKEVGLRMLAPPNDRKRGSLSVLIQQFATVDKVCIVPPGAFFPPPNVDSIVIELSTFASPKFAPNSYETFDKFNRALFSQPRKSIRNCLKKEYSVDFIALLEEESGISFGLRPANLSNEEIVDLVTMVEKIQKWN